MAKVFDSTLHLPLASEQLAELKACAKFRHTQATSLARQLLAEGLVKLTADMPKPEKRKDADYAWHKVHLSSIDKLTNVGRDDVDWFLSLGICEIDAQGYCQQTEPIWPGKHAGQINPYDGFYSWGGRYMTEDSPTMLEDRIRGTRDWDKVRQLYLDKTKQDAYNAQRRSPTTGTVVLTHDTTKSLEQLLSED